VKNVSLSATGTFRLLILEGLKAESHRSLKSDKAEGKKKTSPKTFKVINHRFQIAHFLKCQLR